jgi:DNA replication ATP-dependent helicase Dna2
VASQQKLHDMPTKVDTPKEDTQPVPPSAKQLASDSQSVKADNISPQSNCRAVLPLTIDNPRECRSCYSVNGCMLYRKVSIRIPCTLARYTFLTIRGTQALDEVTISEDDPIAELFEKKTGHLTDDHAAFFRKWEHLVTVEEQDMIRFKNQLWTMTAQEREKTGR